MCHGVSVSGPRLQTTRQISQTNRRLEFQPSNPSFHPVARPRRSDEAPSLLPPYRVGSMITCTDCHNSDSSRFAGGTGANGPHGSLFEPLLVRNYETEDSTSESAEAYNLCYQCHDRNSILGDESFSRHRRHIVDIRAPCSVCHDPHGIYRGQGNARNHSHLINFDLSVVSPADGRIEYEDTGRLSGTCTLTCHGFPHVSFPYVGTAVGGVAARTTGLGQGAGR